MKLSEVQISVLNDGKLTLTFPAETPKRIQNEVMAYTERLLRMLIGRTIERREE